MKRIILTSIVALAAICAFAVEKTDQIPADLTITAEYEQQLLECPSGAAWLLTLKNDGNGPQCKPGKGGIVTYTSIGTVKKIVVEWGNKSNEDIIVYGAHEAITSPTDISGEELGTIPFAKNSTSSIEIEGEWEYIGMTATDVQGKACQFVSMEVIWETVGDEPVPDDQEGLVLNEICGNDGTADDGSEDWIEIGNASDHEISLNGAKLVKIDDSGEESVLCTFSDDAVLAPGAWLVVERPDFEDPSVGISNNKNLIIKIISAKDNVLDKFDKRVALTNNGHHFAGGSYSRIPDFTGVWMEVENATKGTANDDTPIQAEIKRYMPLASAADLVDGLEFILVNVEHEKAMSTAWDVTKDGGVYQLAETIEPADGDNWVDVDVRRVVVCRLADAGDGKWGIYFGGTNNYNNDGRYLACETFKSFKFKKSVDKSGVPCSITFNDGGDVEISYGEEAGSVKFNYKGDGSDRFLNYDPTDKPDEHLAVYIYVPYEAIPDGIESVSKDLAPTEQYTLQGLPATPDYRGIVIEKGKKTIRK